MAQIPCLERSHPQIAVDQGGADNWGEVNKVAASDAEDNDQFGNSVSPAPPTAF